MSMDTPKPRKTKPLSGTYRKFRHLDRVLRDGASSDDTIRRAAAEMWVAIAKANKLLNTIVYIIQVRVYRDLRTA